jgi:hypothetical protein
MQMGAYIIAAEGTSIQSMYRAMKAYLQKRVNRDNHTFAPSAAEFAEQCRYQMLLIEHEQSPNIRRSLTEEPQHNHSYEHRMKMMGLLRTLRRALDGDREAQKSLVPWGWKL